MIHDAVEYIRKEVRDYLAVTDEEVVAANPHVLKEQENASGAYIGLVRVEEEPSLRNTEHHVRAGGTTRYQEPAVFLNLYLLFGFEFESYDASLMRLSQTIELFQSKRVFSADNDTVSNPFPTDLEKLVFDFHNLNFEQLNHLWGVLGGAYFPSVLYKVRLVKIRSDADMPAPEITSIRMDINQP